MPKSHRKKTRRGGGMWDDFKNKSTHEIFKKVFCPPE
jgi:hypothetical protein